MMMDKRKTVTLLVGPLVASSMPASAELIAGWDIWDSASAPTATRLATNVTATAATTLDAGPNNQNWRINDGRGASADGDWGSVTTDPPASTEAGQGINNECLELGNATSGGTITFSITNEGAADIVLDSFNFDSYAFRPKAARAYELSVLEGGGISPGIIYTSADDEITTVRGAWDNLAHDDIDHSLTGLEDRTLGPGESVDFLLAFSSGAGDGSGGHDLWVDNVAIFSAAGPEPGPALDIESSGGDLVFTWDSTPGKVYALHSEVDPSASGPLDWPILDSLSDIAATPPANTLTIPRPADPMRFFAIEEYNAPPISIYSVDFETGQDGWTTAVELGDGSTAWAHGTPAEGGGMGPSAANSGTMVFGTNLAGSYTADHTVILTSPAIDLTGVGEATLRYFEFKDIEEMFDVGSVRILDAADDSVIAVIAETVDGSTTEWTEVVHPIPAAGLDQLVKLEFRFSSDGIDAREFAGWYLDDIQVTVP